MVLRVSGEVLRGRRKTPPLRFRHVTKSGLLWRIRGIDRRHSLDDPSDQPFSIRRRVVWTEDGLRPADAQSSNVLGSRNRYIEHTSWPIPSAMIRVIWSSLFWPPVTSASMLRSRTRSSRESTSFLFPRVSCFTFQRLSKSNASCNACTPSSMYFRSTSTEILIS